MSQAAPEAISPTAHYTGYVWARNGLSHPLLATRQGRVLYEMLRPVMMVSSAAGGPTLESYLLARHGAIDVLLERALAHDGVTQVLELACGLSPRGWRFARRYGDRITYVETDLPKMADRKRRALERVGSLSDHHRVETLDVLRSDGPASLSAVTAALDRDAGIAVVVEGLIGYLETDVLESIWRRLAHHMAEFRVGVYLSDMQFGGQAGWAVRGFRTLLGAFVGGRVTLHHFNDPVAAARALERAGFSSVAIEPASALASPERRGPGRGALLAHVARARTG
jgi:O-methyltransferase involved in polyketide biosynthesis